MLEGVICNDALLSSILQIAGCLSTFLLPFVMSQSISKWSNAAQVLVQQCHKAGVDLRGAGLQPGINLVAAHLNADQAIALLGLVPVTPANPALAFARQALELTAAQASSHEAMYYCTVS